MLYPVTDVAVVAVPDVGAVADVVTAYWYPVGEPDEGATQLRFTVVPDVTVVVALVGCEQVCP